MLGELIEGKVFKGSGLGSKIDYPTVNIENKLPVVPGIYIINNVQYGKGCAFVLPEVTEIHFFKKMNFDKNYLSCNIVGKITKDQKDKRIRFVDVFYKGIEKINEFNVS